MRVTAVALLAALSAACDADVPPYVQTPTSPTIQKPTTITLTALVGIGATATQATITARVLDQQNRGVPGVPVSFAASRGTLSTINCPTNNQGDAQTTLYSGVSSLVTVAGAGMTASLPVTIIAPLSVSLDLRSPEKNVSTAIRVSVLPTPAPPVVYRWDFGDGSTAQTSDGIVNHAWRDDGHVTMEVTVTDALERTGTGSTLVTVRDNPPPPEPPAPTPGPALALTVTCSADGLTASCNASASFGGTPIPSSQVFVTSWDWGDGVSEPGPVAMTHVYPVAGSYTVFVTATAPTPNGPQTVSTTTSVAVASPAK